MRQCRQCQHSLENEPQNAPGPVLGESYVLLPTASASQSMLLMQKMPAGGALPSSSTSPDMDDLGGFGEDLYASARYNLSLQQQHQQEQQRQQEKQQAQRRQKLKQHQRRQQQQQARDGSSYSSAGRYFEEHVGHVGREEDDPTLAESIVVPTHADLSRHVQLLTTHYDHCAGRPVTTPVCKECLDTMLKLTDDQAERARYEKRCFTGYLHTTGSAVRNEEADAINDKIRFYEDELRALEENLGLMEIEREAISQQEEALYQEELTLLQEEKTLWDHANELQWAQVSFEETRDAGTAQIDAMERKVASAKHLNILTDMFVISQSGAFGTINHFRMGQSASGAVEWNEINAAFGESALLLQTLANMVGLEFTDFKVVPLGSFSKMIRTSSLRMEYSLHGSDQENFAESHFNLGLGAWLTCLGQLMAFVQARNASMRLPYKVAKRSIGGYSVLYLKNKHKEWTKALKYALTNLKWLLTWASARGYTITAPRTSVTATHSSGSRSQLAVSTGTSTP